MDHRDSMPSRCSTGRRAAVMSWNASEANDSRRVSMKGDLKLKALRASTDNDPTMKKLVPDFRFVLQDAEDSLKANIDAAREDEETTHEESTPAKKK